MIRLATASLVLVLALAAKGSAGALDDRGGGKAGLETANAHVPEGGGVAVAEGDAGATGRPGRDAPQSGNPLWTIPLSALAATRDRPLFSASRRPPALDAHMAPPPQAPLEPAPAGPAPPETPALALIGTIISPATSVAMLRDTGTQAITRLREGEEASGWRLKTIELRSVIVEKGERSAVLALPKRLDTPGEQPSANPLALEDQKNKR